MAVALAATLASAVEAAQTARARGTLPETAAYVAAVKAAGGSVSAHTVLVLNEFIYECKGGANVWAAISAGVLHIFLGDNLTTALVPQVNALSATITNNNFVAGDYDERTGLTGDGSTKSLDTGVTLPSFTTGSMAAYLHSSLSAAGTASLIGCRNAGNTQRYRLTRFAAPSIAATYGATAGATYNAEPEIGLWGMTRDSATSLIEYRNGINVASTNTSTTGTTPGCTVTVFADRNPTAPQDFLAGTIGGYWIGGVLTEEQWRQFAAAWDRLNVRLGRRIN